MSESIFDRTKEKINSIRRSVNTWAEKRVSAAEIERNMLRGIGNVSGGNQTGSSLFGSQAANSVDQSKALRQYQSFKNTVATALRPIMVRFATQPIRAGYTATRTEIASDKDLSGLITKMFTPEAEKHVRESAPSWIKSHIGSDVTALASHPLLDTIESPNEYMTQVGLMQCTAASLMLTGRVAWWFDSSGDVREETGTATRIWYVPYHWLTPNGPRTNPYSSWILRIPSAGQIEIDGEDIFASMVPHPEDPSKSWSAVQSQAGSVDTDENILLAQHTSMKNVIRPNLIITAGRVPGLPNGTAGNRGPRAMLDASARSSLIEAIKAHYQGVMKFGEPLVLDALIEDVKPLIAGPMELDLVNSSAVTQSRIMQGIGTSPVVAGYSENANRSGSVVAHEVFYELVLNPLISLFGQSLCVFAKRRYGKVRGRTSLRVWMDEAKPRDTEQAQTRFVACKEVLKVGEIREYLRSGNLIIEENIPEDKLWLKDFIAAQQTQPPQPA